MAFEKLVDALDKAILTCDEFLRVMLKAQARAQTVDASAFENYTPYLKNRLRDILSQLSGALPIFYAGARLCRPRERKMCAHLVEQTFDAVQTLRELISQLPVDIYIYVLQSDIHSQIVQPFAEPTRIIASCKDLRKHLLPLNEPAPKYSRSEPGTRAMICIRSNRSPDEQNATLVKVFYATDRRPTAESSTDDAAFDCGRGIGKLTYGEAEVSVPPAHQMGWLERPSIFSFRSPDGESSRHFLVSSSRELSLGDWRQAVLSRQEFLGSEEILIFIHGFNVTFDDALMRTAQISKDLQYDGITACFSWGSEESVWGYAADADNAYASADAFATFIRHWKKYFPDSGIHIIAHSMGNRVLFKALQSLSVADASQIQEVVMAAPDVDTGHFEAALVTLRKRAKRYTLYASDADIALALSSLIRTKYARLGQGGNGIFVAEGVDTVDGSEAVTALVSIALNHADLFEKERLLCDLHYVIRHRTPVELRYGLVKMPKGGLHYWRLRSSRRAA
ncbi:alpha/beta hydrolase [Caballeronia sp. 15715]|uniref:alpha/beta hydrolase n=1 Tax=Caballeronia sp. 15715 TaxID=3391030 RepID=UPI0039E2C2C1